MGKNRRQKVHVISMGCAKNLVDSEKLMAQLRLSNIDVVPTVEGADIAVINTCGFIEAAKAESIDAIVEQVRLKSHGKIKQVFAMGCLAERYREDLRREIPEVDRFFGTNELPAILRELGAEYKEALLGERILTTPPHYAFLKISEGCDNPCSFCAIPLMRGKHVSRPEDEILDEVRLLSDKGVKEVIVIGQDTTYYGLDAGGSRRLPEILERIADVKGIEWVRLMYAYPAKFPLEVLDVIARHPGICKYIDLPIQHIADPVLKSMRRGISSRALRDLLAMIRERIPGVAIRTTLIVGYPAETEREFDELLEFVREEKFHRLGVFSYSPEEGTTGYDLGDPIPAAEKERRRGLILEAQQDLSLARNEQLVGSTLRVLIDRQEDGRFVGRTEHDAPEIDNEVYIESPLPLSVGQFCDVDIQSVSEYDLYGRV